jgi:hypothetical protein
MKPKEKIALSLVTFALLTFTITNPFNWTNDDGNIVATTPIEWMLYGIASYFLFRLALVSYKELVESRPKRIYVRNSRSHYNARKGK